MNLRINYDLWDVVRRLKELGLTMGPLTDAVRRGYLAAASCTPNHPPLVRGIVGWGEIVCALREHLASLGWYGSDDNNYSRVFSQDGRVAIAVATGDEATGKRDGFPATKSLKGPQTAAAITLNQYQMDLFRDGLQVLMQEPAPEPERCMTYILLVHCAEEEVRSELSLPDQITEEGRVNGWRERNILTPIPLDGEPIEIIPPSQPNLDIDVKRKAS